MTPDNIVTPRVKLKLQTDHIRGLVILLLKVTLILFFLCISSMEIDNDILQVLMDVVHQLVSQGDLMLAKILRRKVLEKVEQKKQMQLDNPHHLTLWESHHMTTK